MLAALLTALFALLATVEAAARCTETAAPEIKVTHEWSEPVQVITMPAAQLPVSARRTSAMPGHSVRQLGSTVWQLSVRSRFVVEESRSEKGCYRLQLIEARVMAPELKVYIASELDPATCPFRVTYDHEQKHVSIVRQTMIDLAERLHNDFRDRSLRQTIPADNIRQAVERFRRAVNVVAGDSRKRSDEIARRRNSALDTRESYRAEQALCPIEQWRTPFG